MSSRKQKIKEQQMLDEIARLEEQKKFLELDRKRLEDAMSSTEAAAEIIAYVSKQDEPFGSAENIWTKSDSGACCSVM